MYIVLVVVIRMMLFNVLKVASGKIVPVINETFFLSEATEASKYLEQGRTVGKVVLVVKE